VKLFFDQNISYLILKKIENLFPNSIHTSSVGLNGQPDKEIRKYCQLNDYTIVTFDADFYELANLFGHPPKIIWIRTGNMSTNNIAKIVSEYSNDIKDFVTKKEFEKVACLEIESLPTQNSPT
jgi:predicted nuclease of predicted toxin-antitoxin system